MGRQCGADEGVGRMMKLKVTEKSARELRQEYPIEGTTPGWFYRLTEVSNGYWRLEGSDRWSRKISLDGIDPDVLLQQAGREASKING